MKRMIYVAILAVIFCVTSLGCKREIDFNAFPDPRLPVDKSGSCSLTIVKVDDSNFGVSLSNFSYDNLGRLIKITSGSKITTYTYSLNKVASKNQNGESSEIILLNGVTVASASGIHATSTGFNYAATKHYTYNEFGYLIQISSFRNSELFSNEDLDYINGNLSKCTATFIDSDLVETTTYSYSNKLATEAAQFADPLSFHTDYFTGGYYGKPSKNILIKSAKIVTNGTKHIEDTNTTFAFKYDLKGNINSLIKTSATNLSGATGLPIYHENIYKYDFVYTCN